MHFLLLLAVLAVLACALPAGAKPYTDAKQRFSLERREGWALTPLPGDATGMMLRARLAIP